MKTRRRRQGFQLAGSLRPEQLGLSSKRSREMQLLLAWRRVAGEVMARRAPALGVRRGVLEIEAGDARWADTLRRLLPGLAGRVAMICPALRIRRCRVVQSEAEDQPGETVPVLIEKVPSDVTLPAPQGRAARTPEPRPVEESSQSERLRTAMQRYLSRAGDRRSD